MTSLPQNKQQLVELLGFDSSEFEQVLDRAPNLYDPYYIPKKSGGRRRIEPPRKELKQVQRQLVDQVFRKLPSHELIYPRYNCTIRDALLPHQSQPIVITLDVKDFFPSIKREAVGCLYRSFGFNNEISNLLERLTTYKGHLPQGAPTSPIIARHYSTGLIEKVLSYLPINNTQLTVYADDIIISGPSGLKRSISGITKLARRHRLTINRDKIRVMHKPSDQRALGVLLHPRLHMPLSFVERMERHRANGDMKKYKGMLSYRCFIEGNSKTNLNQ